MEKKKSTPSKMSHLHREEMNWNFSVCLFLGIILRAWLFFLPRINSFISSLPEVSTPVTSWNRVTEGLSMMHQGNLMHEGDSYHGSTLTLLFVDYLQSLTKFAENAVFVICDLISAIALYRFSKTYLEEEVKSQACHAKSFAPGVESILLKRSSISRIPVAMFALYLINPFTVSTCVAKSTLTFNNMFVALFLQEAMTGSVLTMSLFLALSTYESFYPVMLIVPASFCYNKYRKSNFSPIFCFFILAVCTSLWLMVIFYVAYLHENSKYSIFQHFAFLLTVPDQTPNVGLFWYFFSEVFDHFRPFFMFVFQLNVFVFAIPLSIKLRSHPVHLAFLMLGSICILKSYPSFGDGGLWLSLLPLWSHTFRFLRLHVVSSVMLVTTSILCPVMWHMWIYARSANANFFFAATLAYNTAQVLILTDVTLSYLKWHFHLRNGLEPCLPDTNEKAEIRLQV